MILEEHISTDFQFKIIAKFSCDFEILLEYLIKIFLCCFYDINDYKLEFLRSIFI